MRRLPANTLLAIIPLAVALLAPAGAQADGAGHNPPTRKLEAAFSVALGERVASADGCYPALGAMARAIATANRVKTAVTPKLGRVKKRGIVYLVRKGSGCNGVRLALRDKSGLYVLDSTKGEIRVIGGERERALSLARANRGPLRGIGMVTRNVSMDTPNRRDRFNVGCRGKSYPLGGGWFGNPLIAADGEGAYPQSFERLGAQRGWHITGWLFDPMGDGFLPRTMTLQVICGKGLVPETAPHATTFTKPGETKTVIARCPKGSVLMSGGFQRTDFLAFGGNYVTESRADGPRAWRVTGRAFGNYGGELTSIAYCVRSKKPLLTQVEASVPLPFRTVATATTPACPSGRRLTSGGFVSSSDQTYFAGGQFAGSGWQATGYGYHGPADSFTAIGYCLQPGK